HGILHWRLCVPPSPRPIDEVCGFGLGRDSRQRRFWKSLEFFTPALSRHPSSVITHPIRYLRTNTNVVAVRSARSGSKKAFYPVMFPSIAIVIVLAVNSRNSLGGMVMGYDNVAFFDATRFGVLPSTEEDIDLRQEMFSEPLFEGIVGQSAAL